MSARLLPPMAALLVAAGVAGLGAGGASAAPCLNDEVCTVSNGGASIQYDAKDDDPNDSLLSGLENWTVKGVNQLFQQVFAVKIGAGATTNIGNLDFLSADADDTTDTITANYRTADGLLSIGLTMTLILGGNTNSGIDQTLTVTAEPGLFDTPISIFLYTDLDLGGDFGGDTGTSTSDTLTQSDGRVAATVHTPTQTSAFQLDDSFPFLFDAINDGTLGDSVLLNGATGPLAGDLNHAFQWTFELDANDPTFTIGAEATVDVPAPASLGLVGLGFAAIGMLRRRTRG